MTRPPLSVALSPDDLVIVSALKDIFRSDQFLRAGVVIEAVEALLVVRAQDRHDREVA